MAPLIDPDWEYFVPDPEIEEIFQESRSKVRRVDELNHQPGMNNGMRFGGLEGAPLHTAMPKRVKDRHADGDTQCPACKRYFIAKVWSVNRVQKYCSVFCKNNRFKLIVIRKNKVKKPVKRPQERLDTLRDLIKKRVPRNEILAIMGISLPYYYMLRKNVNFGRFKYGRKDPLKYPIR